MIGHLKRDFDKLLTSPSFLQHQNKVMSNLQDIRNGIAVTTEKINDILTGSSPLYPVFGEFLQKRKKKKKKKNREDIQIIMKLGKNLRFGDKADNFYVNL